MLHPSSFFKIINHTRDDGKSAVKTAAYIARTSFRDERVGRRYRAGKKAGLLSHELINWSGTEEELWNAAEFAERKGNARVARELRPGLPADLPVDMQIRLVRGYSLWLRDRYGVAVQADIHAPRFLDEKTQKRHEKGQLGMGWEEYLEALFDPKKTNLNFHVHMLLTTRAVCPKTGEFGGKTRILDGSRTGPQEFLEMRREWEKRTNALLKEIGSDVRIDLRSYEAMAAAGDAPHGLQAQEHMGPKLHARSRKRMAETGEDDTPTGKRRRAQRESNNALWEAWEIERARSREEAREEAARIASEREAERKEKADAEKRRLRGVTTAEEAEAAVAAANQFDSLRLGPELAAALAWASGEPDETSSSPGYSSPVDLEIWVPPSRPQPEPLLEPKVQRVRRKGPPQR